LEDFLLVDLLALADDDLRLATSLPLKDFGESSMSVLPLDSLFVDFRAFLLVVFATLVDFLPLVDLTAES
jgi:hypothetical protein